jgi:hypothetical protein
MQVPLKTAVPCRLQRHGLYVVGQCEPPFGNLFLAVNQLQRANTSKVEVIQAS